MAGSSTSSWSPHLRLDSQTSPFDSPLPGTHKAFAGVPAVSWKRLHVGGILLTVYGLDELGHDSDTSGIACCWLLHGRGDTQDSMAFCAGAFISAWQKARKEGQPPLVCVAFDQRNHGSRMIDNRSNESWKGGNPTHGPDMFSIYSGTAQDVSFLISHLPEYIPFTPRSHLCCGVSLGGHATWQVILHDPRVTAAIVVIGSPDYIRLMTDRAARSSISTYTSTNPPGRDFLGSKDFPANLMDAVHRYDPAGLLVGQFSTIGKSDIAPQPPDDRVQQFSTLLKHHLGGKTILNLAGAKDRLVPHAQSEPFLNWLSNATKPGGWCQDSGIRLSCIVDDNGLHEFSASLRKEAEDWLCRVLADESFVKDSKL
ncbi:hypothetical protein K431DRAFT_230145 [Polychaeton citri CBS 116435]|uniref:Alpha/beta-hydrolase n=1 Tax=Polychaeton citri CBS 116435 TaxID=1314669 RepID=A0A9P4Q3M6_9PEZI|nr:hypothetical protein K431DRAFT_230145 [Polychaeton citri CBS 116435]